MQCPTTTYTNLHDIVGIFGKDTSFGSVQISISINSHYEGEEWRSTTRHHFRIANMTIVEQPG
jgi:hypothetical protein